MMRREIFEGLNIIEHWNSANRFIFYSKQGDIAAYDVDAQEITILAMHLLQASLIYVNTLAHCIIGYTVLNYGLS